MTLGQYLQPSRAHLPVERYLDPAEFDEWGVAARRMGFAHVESGPLVRSSYHAWSHVPPALAATEFGASNPQIAHFALRHWRFSLTNATVHR